jgi:hypothetical protein
MQGTDEHGQKIAQTAEGLGVQPIDICDKYAGAFQELNKRMGISNDFYIRTTMQKHKVRTRLYVPVPTRAVPFHSHGLLVSLEEWDFRPFFWMIS